MRPNLNAAAIQSHGDRCHGGFVLVSVQGANDLSEEFIPAKMGGVLAQVMAILVRDGGDVLAIESVCYMESADDYVAIHTADDTHIKLDRLNKLQERLDSRIFCRIHRSYLLNINYLARIESETKDSKLAILTNGKELPISRSGYGSLKKLL